MASITVGFSIPEEDLARLDRLTEEFPPGNRSAFLRVAMKHVEVLERAGRLRDLQTFRVEQRSGVGLDDVDIETIVHRVLSKRPTRHEASRILE